MKLAPVFLALVAGFGAGWLVRGMKKEPPQRLAERRDAPARRDVERTPREADPLRAPKRTPDRGADPAATRRPDGGGTPPSATDPEDTASGCGGSADADGDPIAEFIESQRGQWKGFALMQAKSKVKGLLAGLGFDEQTAAQIEAAILAEVERQMDLAIDMMIGTEELNVDAFATFLGLPPDLTTDLEAKLGGFLNDAEIDSVRGRVKEAYKKQLGDMADMQIGMMSISNLTDDQRGQLKEIYTGRDLMTEQFMQFAELTRDRDRLKAALADDKLLDEAMRRNFEPTRRRVQDVLTPEQFKAYEKYEQSMVAMARSQLKMMQGLLTPDEKPNAK